MALSREQIASANDVKMSTEDVPEWGGEVCLRTMTGEGRQKIDAQFLSNQEGFRIGLLLHTICDEDGTLVFGDKDHELLAQRNGAVLDRLFTKACILNGYVKDGELEGNSGGEAD